MEGEAVRVCDWCVREDLKMRMRLETGDMGFVLLQRLESLREERKRQEIEGKSKESAILTVQKTANQRIISGQQKLEELEQGLIRETDQYDRKKNIVKELKAGLAASKEAEQMAKSRLDQLQAKLASLREEIRTNKLDCEQILESTDHSVAQLRGRISKTEGQRTLCQNCKAKITETNRPAERMASLETITLKRPPEGCACVLS
jgi:chromosome segregation ATPase